MDIERRPPTQDEIDALTSHLLTTHPICEVSDLYKLGHQAVLGPGHMLGAKHLMRDALVSEAQLLDPAAAPEWEVPVETIHPSWEMARVHLRPYLRSGGSLDRLLDAMYRTQTILGEPDKAALAGFLGQMRASLKDRSDVPFKLARFDALMRDQVQEGFIPTRHSDAFRETYDPHYRVVLLEAMV